MSGIITVNEDALRILVEKVARETVFAVLQQPLGRILNGEERVVRVVPVAAKVRFTKPGKLGVSKNERKAAKVAALIPAEVTEAMTPRPGKPGPKPGFRDRPAPSVQGMPTQRGPERSETFMRAILTNLVKAEGPVPTLELRNAIDPSLIASELLYHMKRAIKLGYVKPIGDRLQRKYQAMAAAKRFLDRSPQPVLNGAVEIAASPN